MAGETEPTGTLMEAEVSNAHLQSSLEATFQTQNNLTVELPPTSLFGPGNLTTAAEPASAHAQEQQQPLNYGFEAQTTNNIESALNSVIKTRLENHIAKTKKQYGDTQTAVEESSIFIPEDRGSKRLHASIESDSERYLSPNQKKKHQSTEVVELTDDSDDDDAYEPQE